MSKGKRFFIFLSSAGIMTFFLFFTLSVREDKPLNKYMEWLPGNRVLSSLLERKDIEGNPKPKVVEFNQETKDSLQACGRSRLDLIHALRSGDVEFFHHLTSPRSKVKQYYILVDIDGDKYGVLANVNSHSSEIVGFGAVISNQSNQVYLVYTVVIAFLSIVVFFFRRLFKRFNQ